VEGDVGVLVIVIIDISVNVTLGKPVVGGGVFDSIEVGEAVKLGVCVYVVSKVIVSVSKAVVEPG
jgi:hypothetical protein